MNFHNKRGNGMSEYTGFENADFDEIDGVDTRGTHSNTFVESAAQGSWVDQSRAAEPQAAESATAEEETRRRRPREERQSRRERKRQETSEDPREPRRRGGAVRFLATLAAGGIFLPPAFASVDLFFRDGQENALIASTLAEFQFKQNPPRPQNTSATPEQMASPDAGSNPTAYPSPAETSSPSAKPSASPTGGVLSLPHDKKHKKTAILPADGKGAPRVVLELGNGTASEPGAHVEFMVSPTQRSHEKKEIAFIAKLVKDGLTKDGYSVFVAQKRTDIPLFSNESVDTASNRDADLIVAIDEDHSKSTKYQEVRSLIVEGNQGDVALQGTVCTHPAVARESMKYAIGFAQERQKAQGHHVEITDAELIKEQNFQSSDSTEAGNESCPQDGDKRTWFPKVYNNAGVERDGHSKQWAKPEILEAYADGLIEGTKVAVSRTPRFDH
jgi:hypothetical protein